jgi:ABC-2 type transport system ATP-binding protein
MLLATDRLSKQYDRTLALNNVSLQIRQGEVYGLIGPNGAGKTTLLRLLAAADEPTTGKIFLGGQLLQYGEYQPVLKRRLGFLPDDYPLYDDLTVEGYLDYMARLYFLGHPLRSQRLQTVLAQVQLESKRKSLIKTLSRGMRQRLSLAQSILHQPDVLLMDEPVSGLDPLARSQFRQIVKQLQAEGMTIVISSHILSDLEDFCSAIGIMEQGRLVESAVLSELYDRRGSQILQIRVLDPMDDWLSIITQQAGVRSVEGLPPDQAQVEFVGDAAARAHLLRSLLAAGLTITDFHQTQENLESIFLKMDYQRTS